MSAEGVPATNPADEIVAIVDAENRVVGSALRRDMRQHRLLHRSTYILIFNSCGDLCVQKRTATKDVFPGYYDIAAGGVVLAGESYEAGARRELAEEVGIQDVPLAHQFVFHYADDDTQVWGSVFSCVYDGELVLQKEEVESAAFMPVVEVLSHAEHAPYTPDGLYVLRRYLGTARQHPKPPTTPSMSDLAGEGARQQPKKI
jgi:8-oxo-dGTP pyrophosphatase MutT (NUDIX family)